MFSFKFNVKSLYDQCLREVLKTRDIQLFVDLALLQIKRDPLDGTHADTWIDSAAENPLVLDWLVIFTDCRLSDLFILVYPVALDLCCIDTLDWFIEQMESELNMTNPDLTYIEIITRHFGPKAPFIKMGFYTDALWSFLRKDHLETAKWLIKHGCLSSYDIWYVVKYSPMPSARKIAEYLAEEPNQEHRKLQLAGSPAPDY